MKYVYRKDQGKKNLKVRILNISIHERKIRENEIKRIYEYLESKL